MTSSFPEYDHVILISLDNLRSDCIAKNPYRLWPALFPGLKPPDTTFLDDFASSGAFFVNAITAAPYTSASHATYLTGQFPLHHGLFEFYGGAITSPTLFTYAKQAGSSTIAKVDFPIILGSELGFTRDVDRYLIEDDQGFLDAVAEAKSSLAFAHFGGIHVPYGFHKLRFGGDDYRDMVARLESELPSNLPFHLDALTETYRESEDSLLFLRYKRAVHYFYEAGMYSRLFDLYLRGLEYFLQNRFQPFLTQLIDRLTSRGKRYLIVLFGDHGHEFAKDSFGNFNSLAEGVLRVPVIFVGTDVQPGLYSERIRTADVTPTIMALTRYTPSPAHALDGQSLAPVIKRGESPPGDLIALSQAYTADANEFVAYQKRQLAGGAPEPLRHILLGEAAYLGNWRVVRRHNCYTETFDKIMPMAGETTVERFDEQLIPHTDASQAPDEALALLDAYSSSRGRATPVIADESVRQGLRNMGYNV